MNFELNRRFRRQAVAARAAEILLATGRPHAIVSSMSTVQEVQEALRSMSPEDRNRVKAFLLQLTRANDPDHKADLTRRIQCMEQGDRVTQAQVEKSHEDLCRVGLERV